MKMFKYFVNVSKTIAIETLPRLQHKRTTSRFLSMRLKSKSPKKQQSSDSSTSDYDLSDEVSDRNSKVLNVHAASMRIDAVLKAAFGIARNKIETSFYENKIKVNGEQVLKKSIMAAVGDEIDLIKGPDPKNPNLTLVARVEILGAKAKEDTISLKVRRNKALLVDYTTKDM